MSLLQGLLGFGAGAAQSLAETKKADMAQQRELNLAKLKAQYQKDQAIEIAGMGMSDDPTTRAAAGILGYKPQETPEPAIRTFIDPNNPEGEMLQIDVSTQAGRQQARAAIDSDLIQINTPTRSQLTGSEDLTADQSNFNAQVALEMELDPELTEIEAKRIVRDRLYIKPADPYELNPEELLGYKYEYTGPQGQQIFRLSPGAPGGRIRVTNPDGSPVPYDPDKVPNFAAPESQVPELLKRDVGPDIASIPPADYISFGTGPVDTLLGAGLRIPIIGDLLAASNDPSNGNLQRAARTSINLMKNDIIRAYRQNDGRTTNKDMELNEVLVPAGGFWATEEAFYADASELRRDLKRDIERNNRIVKDGLYAPKPIYSPEQVEAAVQFLTEAQGLVAKLDGYLVAYGFENKSINYKGANVKIRDLTERQINNISPEEYLSLPTEIAYLVDAWAQYNNFKITD